MAYMGFLDDRPLHAFCALASPALGFSAFIVHAMNKEQYPILCTTTTRRDFYNMLVAAGSPR